MSPLEKVRAELLRYEHPLVEFAAEETEAGVELLIRLKDGRPGVHTWRGPVHPRDIAHPQFAWSFQRFLYDCLHDYMVELFIRTPEMRTS